MELSSFNLYLEKIVYILIKLLSIDYPIKKILTNVTSLVNCIFKKIIYILIKLISLDYPFKKILTSVTRYLMRIIFSLLTNYIPYKLHDWYKYRIIDVLLFKVYISLFCFLNRLRNLTFFILYNQVVYSFNSLVFFL